MRLVKNENGKEFVMEQGFWTGKTKLFVDGEELVKVDKKSYRYNDEIVSIKGNFLSGVTLNFSQSESVAICANKWYEFVLIYMPYLYVAIGVLFGAIGGALSAFAAISCCVLNAYILRSKGNLVVKIILCIVLFIALFFVWFIITINIASLILN